MIRPLDCHCVYHIWFATLFKGTRSSLKSCQCNNEFYSWKGNYAEQGSEMAEDVMIHAKTPCEWVARNRINIYIYIYVHCIMLAQLQMYYVITSGSNWDKFSNETRLENLKNLWSATPSTTNNSKLMAFFFLSRYYMFLRTRKQEILE